jgi:cob(I)alamin adenosyltransferase
LASKIYTKTGDAGETALFGGKRVPKHHLRVEAYGSLDELNAFIGWYLEQNPNPAAEEVLRAVQSHLFSIGAVLAADMEKYKPEPLALSGPLQILETEIDLMETALPPLKNFILPGGHPTVALCHLCRTVCRRAERQVVALHYESPVDPQIIQYLNRLSDYLFVLGRAVGQQLGVAEVIWKG